MFSWLGVALNCRSILVFFQANMCFKSGIHLSVALKLLCNLVVLHLALPESGERLWLSEDGFDQTKCFFPVNSVSCCQYELRQDTKNLCLRLRNWQRLGLWLCLCYVRIPKPKLNVTQEGGYGFVLAPVKTAGWKRVPQLHLKRSWASLPCFQQHRIPPWWCGESFQPLCPTVCHPNKLHACTV